MLKNYIAIESFIESIEDGDYEPSTKNVILYDIKKFVDFISKNSTYLGKYNFIYIFENKPSLVPGLINMSKSQFKMIPSEVSKWTYIDNDLSQPGINVSSNYSLFLDSGRYIVNDFYIVKVA